MKINAILLVGFLSFFICGASVLLALPGISDPQALLVASASAEKNPISTASSSGLAATGVADQSQDLSVAPHEGTAVVNTHAADSLLPATVPELTDMVVRQAEVIKNMRKKLMMLKQRLGEVRDASDDEEEDEPRFWDRYRRPAGGKQGHSWMKSGGFRGGPSYDDHYSRKNDDRTVSVPMSWPLGKTLAPLERGFMSGMSGVSFHGGTGDDDAAQVQRELVVRTSVPTSSWSSPFAAEVMSSSSEKQPQQPSPASTVGASVALTSNTSISS